MASLTSDEEIVEQVLQETAQFYRDDTERMVSSFCCAKGGRATSGITLLGFTLNCATVNFGFTGTAPRRA